MTSTDVTNGYITIDSSINYVAKLFPIASGMVASRNFFDIKYQMALSDIASMYSYIGDLSYYDQMQQYLSTLDMLVSGTPQISFSRRQNRLYIWGDLVDGDIKAFLQMLQQQYTMTNSLKTTQPL